MRSLASCSNGTKYFSGLNGSKVVKKKESTIVVEYRGSVDTDRECLLHHECFVEMDHFASIIHSNLLYIPTLSGCVK